MNGHGAYPMNCLDLTGKQVRLAAAILRVAEQVVAKLPEAKRIMLFPPDTDDPTQSWRLRVYARDYVVEQRWSERFLTDTPEGALPGVLEYYGEQMLNRFEVYCNKGEKA